MKHHRSFPKIATRCATALLICSMIGTTLAGCSQDAGPKETGGTVVGAVAGGLLGSTIGSGSGKAVAIGIGAVLGGIIGSEVGKSLDRADRAYMHRTTQTSLEHSPTGRSSEWVNPDNGHSGTVMPTRTYRADNGRYCREFQQTVTIDGRRQRAYGTACRQPDGTWEIVS